MNRGVKEGLLTAECILNSMMGTVLQNKLTAYWMRGYRNFGDQVTPLLLKKYGFTPVYSSPDHAEVVSVGSILEHVPENYSGYILGSGLIHEHVRQFKNATILALRGELTRQRTGASKSVVLGDPGLLASKLMNRRKNKVHVLGLVPHRVDRADPRILMIRRRYEKDVLVIDVTRTPSAVFEDIDKCQFILSSSLHGIVTADSLGISSAWMSLSNKVSGSGFKFADYNSALGLRPNPLDLRGNESLSDLLKSTRTPPESVGEIKERLHNMFLSLRVTLGES